MNKVFSLFCNCFWFFFGVVSLFSVSFEVVQAAQIPPQILTYQGRLTDSSGNLLGGSGTTYYFKFSVWSNSTVGSGTRLWPSTVPATTTATVKQGVFTVNIGDTANGYPTALNLDFSNNTSHYLQVEVSSDNNSSETLSPRQQITSVAFAQLAGAVVGTTTPSTFGTTTPATNSFVTIAATSSSSIPLSIIGALNQTANLFQIQNNLNSNLFSVSAAGGVTAVAATTTSFFSTTASSTNLFTSNLSIGSLSGFLKATAGVVATALVNLASDVTGTLPVANGGTGATTLTGLLQGNGTGAVTAVTGTAGQFPYYNGTNTLSATSSIFLSTAGYVGIATTSPLAPFTVQASSTLASGAAYGQYINFTDNNTNAAATSYGLYVSNSSQTTNAGNRYGVYATAWNSSVTDEVGALAYTDRNAGIAYGVHGSGGNYGVFGTNNNVGVAGQYTGTSGGGSAVYAFSTSVTSNPLLVVNQSSSAFTGSAINLTMANGSGTFTGNFINASNNSDTKFIVKSDGTTGIGTSTPFATLQIATTTGKNLVLSDSGAGANLKHWLFSSMGGNLYIGTSTDMYATSTPAAFTLLNNGNIGIGTTTPGSLLSIQGVANFTTATSTLYGNGINLTNGCFAVNGTCVGGGSGSGTVNSGTTNRLAYYTGSTAVSSSAFLALNETGNYFGIGTTTPQWLLQLATSTAPQLTLTDGTTNNGWAFRSVGGNFYLASTSALTFATSSTNMLAISNAGLFTVATSGVFTIDANTASTTIGNLITGNMSFDADAGVVTAMVLPIVAASDNTIESMSFQVGNYATSSLTIYAQSDGINAKNFGVGIGTTSPYARLSVVDDKGSSLRDVFVISTSTSGLIFKVDSYGATWADGAYTGTGADYAEYFYTNSVGLKSGEVVCVDILSNNAVKRCERGGDINVMGIVSTKPSVIGNSIPATKTNPSHYVIVGMMGQVEAYVSAENGPVNVGDSLTSASSTPGVAMLADGGDSTVGIALEPLLTGTGKIKVLISRRNKSLAVEEVESLVVERIANMKIEDSVQQMITQGVMNLNLDPKILRIAQDETGKLNMILATGINNNTQAIARLSVDMDLYKLATRDLSNSIGAFASTTDALSLRIDSLDMRIALLENASTSPATSTAVIELSATSTLSSLGEWASLSSPVLTGGITTALQSLGSNKAFAAVFGVFDKIFAREVHTDKLCVGEVCVTQEQFLELVQGRSDAATAPSTTVLTDTPLTDIASSETTATSTGTTASTTAPTPELLVETESTTDAIPEEDVPQTEISPVDADTTSTTAR